MAETTPPTDATSVSPCPCMPKFILGTIMLIVALGASIVLALKHFGAMEVPGCGPGSACAEAAASVWGKVPGLEWPTSLVGVSFFAAVLAGWMICRGRVRGMLHQAIRLGAIMSIVLIIAMVTGGYLCKWCLAVHGANIIFVVIAEMTALRAAPSMLKWTSAATGALAAFVVTTGGLAYMHIANRDRIAEREAQQASQSTQEIIQRTHQNGGTPVETGGPEVLSANGNVVQRPGFTGRWLLGDESAPIRVVVFSDYQCKDCKRVEGELMELFQERDDMSISAKHFPMCTDCNPNMGTKNLHPNACWAAMAAETAGLLGGEDTFWAMHHWLFKREGTFTKEEIVPALPGLNLDVEDFTRILGSKERLPLVEQDIAEAVELGLHYTPMLFINGVEMKGWRTPGAVRRAIEAVGATNPPARTAASDQPVMALQKYVDDWQEQRVLRLPNDQSVWAFGPADATVTVVVWSDVLLAPTRQFDRMMRAIVESRDDVKYVFRSYPLAKACNPRSAQDRGPLHCLAAQATEAAGQLGGADGYWRMHDWILSNQGTFNERTLLESAATLGFDPDQLQQTMQSRSVLDGVFNDASAGTALNVNKMPTVIINDRVTPRWLINGTDAALRAIIDAAANETIDG